MCWDCYVSFMEGSHRVDVTISQITLITILSFCLQVFFFFCIAFAIFVRFSLHLLQEYETTAPHCIHASTTETDKENKYRKTRKKCSWHTKSKINLLVFIVVCAFRNVFRLLSTWLLHSSVLSLSSSLIRWLLHLVFAKHLWPSANVPYHSVSSA